MRAETWTGYAAIPRLLRYSPVLTKPSELLIHVSLRQRMPTDLKVGFMALTVNLARRPRSAHHAADPAAGPKSGALTDS